MRSRIFRVAMPCVAILATASSATADVVSIDEPTFLKRVTAAPHQRALADRSDAASASVDAAAVLPNPHLAYEREDVASLDSTDTFVRLGWPLDIAGRRGLSRDAARAGAEAERASVVQASLEVQLAARLAFLDAIYARERLARLDESRASLLAIVDSLRTRAAQGDASSYDSDRAALELDVLDDERLAARRVLVIARLRLGAFVGEPQTELDAVGTLALPVANATGTPVRSDVAAARAKERQATLEKDAANRTWVPRLDLLVGIKLSTAGTEDGVGYIVGIGGELPVFDRGTAHATKSRAEAKRWRTEAEALTVAASAELEQARRELALRLEQANTYAAAVRRAVDLQKRAAVAYREGDRTILELLDVQRTAREALVHAQELVYDARRAEIAVWRALGRTP